jgi:hypothetical protein
MTQDGALVPYSVPAAPAVTRTEPGTPVLSPVLHLARGPAAPVPAGPMC